MTRFFCLFLFAGHFLDVQAQFLAGPLPVKTESIRQNSISVMDAQSDTVWIGPRLNYRVGNAPDWKVSGADSLTSERFSLFSLSTEPGRLVAGLGFYKEVAGSEVATAGGIYTSRNGGRDWNYIFPPVDPQGSIARPAGTDSLRGYYAQKYSSREILVLAVTVPEQSVPWDVDASGEVIFTASWASGIRRSRDFGLTWDRPLLPPFEQPFLNLESTYNFIYQPTPPRSSDTENPNTGESWTNFLGFSVLVDSKKQVWVGTAGGLNLSANAYAAALDSITWAHAVAGGLPGDMPGNWIITIRENPADSSIWTTHWVGTNTSGKERFGIAQTLDGRQFTTFLLGEKIYDIAFSGNSIFAAGDNGLFSTTDNGRSWKQQRGFNSANNRISERAVVQALAVADETLWVATSEGMAYTSDGLTWNIERTNFSLSGKNQFVEGGKTDVYAYPNPFSNRRHGTVRIRFRGENQQNVRVRIFDSGMQLIRELDGGKTSDSGEYEVLWDGVNRFGQKVSNGVVFYTVQAGGKQVKGKLLILE